MSTEHDLARIKAARECIDAAVAEIEAHDMDSETARGWLIVNVALLLSRWEKRDGNGAEAGG